ncbi:MAG: arsenate reductase ArsC, partial [Phycisphaerae bacterium]|nr:arsenate reductase ArsC [Phycisphaerae bacterium]NIW91446.1 arsenate reductase ArsC [Phycisphaerae bacterium]NIX32677.1 arsenate reductase ArsC [Phycisphaerae bacterium]
PRAIQVMKEIGIDIGGGFPKNVDHFLDQSFDYVVTVCDKAKETCPVFMGDVKEWFHIGFEDPAEATGTDEEMLSVFRRIRDEIRNKFQQFHNEQIKPKEN